MQQFSFPIPEDLKVDTMGEEQLTEAATVT